MKKIIFPIFLLTSVIGQSQVNLYKGRSKGVDVYLTTNGDKYIVGTTLGTLNKANNQYFITGYNQPAQVTAVTGNGNDIEINFSCKSYEYYEGKFKIGYLDSKNKKQYKDVIVKVDENDYPDVYNFKINIPKSKHFYLIINYDEVNAAEFLFELPANAIEVNTTIVNASYPEYKNSLVVDINNDKSIIKISENGNDEIVFSKDFNSTDFINEQVLEIVKTEAIKSTLKYNTETNTYDIYDTIDYKVQSSKTIEQGLKSIKNQSYKYVVVIVENLDQSATINFNSITNGYKTVINEQYYYKNQENVDSTKEVLDNFIFVKATDKDKKWLQNKGFDLKSPKILFVDKTGTILKYSSKNDIQNYDINYSLNNSIDGYPVLTALENINLLHQKIQNGKLKSDEAIQLLKKINTNIISNQNSYIPDTTVVSPENDGHGLDDYQYVPDFKYNFPNISEQKLDAFYNNLLDENIKKFNPEITLIIENELRNSGFSAVLLNKTSSKPFTKTDIKAINLLITNADKVVEYKTNVNNQIANSDVESLDLGHNFLDNFDTTFDSAILEAINSQLYNLSEENYISNNESEILNIIKALIIKHPDKLTYLSRYYDVLTKSDSNVDYVNTNFSDLFILFDKYWSEQFKNSNSYIEVLDEKFSNLTSTDKNFFFDWVGYKVTHANLANNLAWAVVEKRDESKYESAKKWAEFSINLDRFSSYNLDTLAHIYYLTGNINKAIEIQSKAIEMAKLNKDFDSEQNATQVLNKMKNKTL